MILGLIVLASGGAGAWWRVKHPSGSTRRRKRNPHNPFNAQPKPYGLDEKETAESHQEGEAAGFRARLAGR